MAEPVFVTLSRTRLHSRIHSTSLLPVLLGIHNTTYWQDPSPQTWHDGSDNTHFDENMLVEADAEAPSASSPPRLP